MKIAGMVILAALTGWLARGIRFEQPSPPSPSPRAVQPAVQKSEPVAEPPFIVHVVPVVEGAHGKRNLFAYPVHERPYVLAAQPVVVREAPVVAAAAPVAAPVPQPVPFPYRYIGRFGPPHHPVAAFKRDGDVVTLFRGERIGDFVLRSIGAESVEIEGPDGVRRVPLATGL